MPAEPGHKPRRLSLSQSHLPALCTLLLVLSAHHWRCPWFLTLPRSGLGQVQAALSLPAGLSPALARLQWGRMEEQEFTRSIREEFAPETQLSAAHISSTFIPRAPGAVLPHQDPGPQQAAWLSRAGSGYLGPGRAVRIQGIRVALCDAEDLFQAACSPSSASQEPLCLGWGQGHHHAPEGSSHP